eukprot:TRINITY_DN71500_c0_g1_i1.p1 TRINITY_DN71500_c0_g1~~TRINITY_DN71500_c0_g1_i1.p1  ORF type:complete len:1425 (-),score=377.94 TRINITY_DN71500_c0_g1_i1:98-3829(-)
MERRAQKAEAACETLRAELAAAQTQSADTAKETEVALRSEIEEVTERARDAESRARELEQQLDGTKSEGLQNSMRLSSKLAAQRWKDGIARRVARKTTEHFKNQLEDAEKASVSAVKAVEPLQRCIDEGDAAELLRAVEVLKADMEAGEERRREVYGMFAQVVVPFYEAAQSKVRNWQDIMATVRAVIRSVSSTQTEGLPRQQAKRLFNAVREASVVGLNIATTDEDASSQIVQTLNDFFVKEGYVGNNLQLEILRRVAACKNFFEFDFTDLSSCICFADKEETQANDFFLSRATTLVATSEVHEFKDILSLLDTVIFFLRFLSKEDLTMTYKKYRAIQSEPWVRKYIDFAEKQYAPGCELVKTAGRDLSSQDELEAILNQLHEATKTSGCEPIDGLRPIIYSWAKVMMDKFSLLVLPHHTQVVCMIILLEFIRGGRADLPKAKALIAEVGTGEGKSAVLAMMAIYCVVVLGKQVHVVVDDETLLERDFQNFRQLFTQFKTLAGAPVTATRCVSALRKEAHFRNDAAIQTCVDEDADIVYCEAKHIQSFYTRLAKRGGTKFDDVYRNRVLFVDEVDALLIDEAPNVPFVYENDPLSTFATKLAEAFKSHVPLPVIERFANTPTEKKVLRSMRHAVQLSSKWTLHMDYAYDEHANRYFRVQRGRVNQGAWSLALDYKNYSADLIDRITYNERLFVMSRPRTIRKYSRIVGLSGSVGSPAERSFLRQLYEAEYFKVPRFLTTCRDSVCHDLTPLGISIEPDAASQLRTTRERAFDARKRTPVLIIAKDRHQATLLADELQSEANALGLRGCDVVRSLSRDIYENNRDKFKENLFQFLQPVGKGAQKSFRIAVTDPRGGRGTDYRITDLDADANGGLTLLLQHVPKQSRDWIQYLGRTARQGCRGQWTAVLNRKDYVELLAGTCQELTPENAVSVILGLGDSETKAKIDHIHGQYHRGLRMNELCEQLSERNLVQSDESRACLAELCSHYEHMSLAQINDHAKAIRGLKPSEIATDATEVGPDVPATAPSMGEPSPRSACGAQKSVALLLDRSSSMCSNDANGRTRFEVCRGCIVDIFDKNVDDSDFIGLYTFEDKVRECFPLTEKGPMREELRSRICQLPKPDGLTRFHDGVLECLLKLRDAPAVCRSKFLVALTDGDDNMSESQPNGEKVTSLLEQGIDGLNLVVITCGRSVKPRLVDTIRRWTETVEAQGGIGLYIPADRPAQLVEVFAKVADVIDAEGETEI